MKYTGVALFIVLIGSIFGHGEGNTECTVWGKTISDIRNGKITNPPTTTTSRTTCTWTFKVQSSQFLELNFTRMNLVPAHQCQFAYVQVESTEGKNRYCGKVRPPVMYFKGPQDVELSYKFDRDSKLREFALEYKQSRAPAEKCAKGQLSCKNGACVPDDSMCNGLDDCGDGIDEQNCGHKHNTLDPSKCGRPAIAPEEGNEDRVVGGREAVPGSWPWQVSIQVATIFPSGHFCGGSLLNQLWIVSAAHCFVTFSSKTELRIKLGDHRLFEQESGEVVRYSDKIIMHPNYQDQLLDKRHDIALVKMKAPVQFSETISPVCLPQFGHVVPAGTMLHVTGWGRTVGSLSPPIQSTAMNLKQAMVAAVDWKVCYKELLEKLAIETICTSFGDDGNGPCLGDSGGPLVGIDNRTGQWNIFGLVSWGKTTCEFSTTSAVFTKVASYVTWILNTIDKE